MASKKDKYLESAQRFMLKGQLDKAIKDYQQVVALEPKEVRYRQKLAELLVRDSRKEEAIAQYEDIGRHYADNSYFLKAIAVYKQIQRLSPDNNDIALTLASLNHKQGLIGNALSEYGQVAARLEREGDLKGALKVIDEMLSIDADQPATRLKQAELLFTSRAEEESFQTFTSLLKSLRKSGDTAAESRVEERVRQLFPGRQLHDFDRIASQIAAGDLDAAVIALKQVLKSDGANFQAWQLLCDALRRKGDKAALRDASLRMMELFPEDPAVQEGGINSEIQAGNNAQALALLESRLQVFIGKGAAGAAERLIQTLQRDPSLEAHATALLRRFYEGSGDWDKLTSLDNPSGSGAAAEASGGSIPEQPLPLEVPSYPAPRESGTAAADTHGGELPLPWEEDIDLDLDDDLPAVAELPAVGTHELPGASFPPAKPSDDEGAAPAPLAEAVQPDPFADPSPFGEVSPFEEPPNTSLPFPASPVEETSAEGGALPLDLDLDSSLELTLPDDSEFPDFDWSAEAEGASPLEEPVQSPPLGEGQPSVAAESAEAELELPDPFASLEEPQLPDEVEPFEELELDGSTEQIEGFGQLDELQLDDAVDELPVAGYELELPREDLNEPLAAPEQAPQAQPRGWEEIYPETGNAAEGSLDHAELESHYDLGVGYKEMGMYRKAIAEFDLAAGNPQRRLDCLTLQAICYRENGEVEKSKGLLKQGLELEVLSHDERNVISYELAYLLEAKGDSDAAIALYREVHRLNPTFHDVAERLANLSGEEPLDIIELPLEDADL